MSDDDRMAAWADAATLRAFADKVYELAPEDVFPPETLDYTSQVHNMFVDHGLTPDRWSAVIMRHTANMARYLADQAEEAEANTDE